MLCFIPFVLCVSLYAVFITLCSCISVNSLKSTTELKWMNSIFKCVVISEFWGARSVQNYGRLAGLKEPDVSKAYHSPETSKYVNPAWQRNILCALNASEYTAWNDYWITNYKLSWRKWSWPNFKALSQNLPGANKWNHKNLRTAAVWADVWTQDIPNTNQECYVLESGIQLQVYI